LTISTLPAWELIQPAQLVVQWDFPRAVAWHCPPVLGASPTYQAQEASRKSEPDLVILLTLNWHLPGLLTWLPNLIRGLKLGKEGIWAKCVCVGQDIMDLPVGSILDQGQKCRKRGQVCLSCSYSGICMMYWLWTPKTRVCLIHQLRAGAGAGPFPWPSLLSAWLADSTRV